MKQLSIDWFNLEMAFDNSSWEASYYLDLKNGEVLMVTRVPVPDDVAELVLQPLQQST